jgi:hypothetical protein
MLLLEQGVKAQPMKTLILCQRNLVKETTVKTPRIKMSSSGLDKRPKKKLWSN